MSYFNMNLKLYHVHILYTDTVVDFYILLDIYKFYNDTFK